MNEEIINIKPNISTQDFKSKQFIKYIEAPKGEVDISEAEIIIAVGRGIKEEKNLPIVEEFAQVIGGVVAGTRPIIDKNWLAKDRQVGSSGKSVKPKIYIAVGLSGAFQHVTGIKGGTIIAINKDPAAPIFRVADYGIIDDLFRVVPLLIKKVSEFKSGEKN